MDLCHKKSANVYETKRFGPFVAMLRSIFSKDVRGSCGDLCNKLCKTADCFGSTVSADGLGCTCNAFLCDKMATCTNSVCNCNQGYIGDGATCDFDECAAGTDNCHTNAQCTNIPGGFECVCNEGYIGDGVICDQLPKNTFVTLLSPSTETVNPLACTICIGVENAEFNLTSPSLTVNSIMIDSKDLQINSTVVCTEKELDDSSNDIFFTALDDQGNPLELNVTVYAGKSTVEVRLLDMLGNPVLSNVNVKALLADNQEQTLVWLRFHRCLPVRFYS